MSVIDQPTWPGLLSAAVEANAAQPACRHAQLATVRADGRPANRTVVVRGMDDTNGHLWITTDARGAKVEQLIATPWAELCWYFPATREQFRLLGRIHITGAGTPEASRRATVWRQLPEASQATFSGPPPGSPRVDAVAVPLVAPPEPPETFLLLTLESERVEYLDLRPTPHNRLLFIRIEDHWYEKPLHP